MVSNLKLIIKYLFKYMMANSLFSFVIGNEEDFKWDKVLSLVQPVHFHYHGLAEVLMSSGHLLTLYTLALKESQNRTAYPDVLSTLVQCLEAIKPK